MLCRYLGEYRTMRARRIILNKVLLWVCSLAFLFLPGCASSPPAALESARQVSAPNEFEKSAWEDGLLAFKEGDYRKAASIFEALSVHARLPETTRKALFAQAAALLAMAQTPEEYAEAASIWERWSRQAQSGLEGEDPRMLTPFVGRAATQAAKNGSAAAEQAPKARDASNPNLKSALQSKEKEAEGLKAKLEARDREIRRLRHQLESLEEIHRKYQEKKQEASTP